MRRIAFMGSAGMSGTHYCEVEEVPDGTTDEELFQGAWERAVQWAEGFGVYEPQEQDEEGDEGYWDNVEGYWEEYDPEKHLMLKAGGGKWFDDDPD